MVHEARAFGSQLLLCGGQLLFGAGEHHSYRDGRALGAKGSQEAEAHCRASSGREDARSDHVVLMRGEGKE